MFRAILSGILTVCLFASGMLVCMFLTAHAQEQTKDQPDTVTKFKLEHSADGKAIMMVFTDPIPEGHALSMPPDSARAMAACLVRLADEVDGQTKEPPVAAKKTSTCPCGEACDCGPTCQCGAGKGK